MPFLVCCIKYIIPLYCCGAFKCDLPPTFVPPVLLARQARGEGGQARGPQAPGAARCVAPPPAAAASASLNLLISCSGVCLLLAIFPLSTAHYQHYTRTGCGGRSGAPLAGALAVVFTALCGPPGTGRALPLHFPVHADGNEPWRAGI